MKFEELASAWDEIGGDGSAMVARTLNLHGFGGGERNRDTLIVGRKRRMGSVLAGFVDETIAGELEREPRPRVLRVAVADEVAERGGAACGGWVEVIVHPASWLPDVSEELLNREPFCLITAIGPDGPSEPVSVISRQRRVTSFAEETADELLIAGQVGVHRLEADGERFQLHFFSPRPRAVVAGSGELAVALMTQMELAGISATLLGEGELLTLGPLDGLVVLTHDHEAATPIMARMLARGRVGYVGALGSRATQAERRSRLADLGVDPGPVFGPAGLDIGSRSSAETALSIVAEMIAATRGRAGGHLRDRRGPING